MKRLRTLLRVLILGALVSSCGGDSQWSHATPIIDVPKEFGPVGRPTPAGREAFPARAPEVRVAWELRRGGDVSQILMTRYAGSTSPEEVEEAVSTLAGQNRSWTFEAPDGDVVAGRPAWTWSARVPSPQGTLWAAERTLVISYPDSTWVLALWGQHPEWQQQATADRVLGSFRIPKPSRPIPKHPLIVAGVVLAFVTVARLRRPRPEPAKPIPSRAAATVSPPAEPGSGVTPTEPETLDPTTPGGSETSMGHPGFEADVIDLDGTTIASGPGSDLPT